jgi:hypothetical protein
MPFEPVPREIRFKILRVYAGAELPGSAAARAFGCSCPAAPNRAGVGWAVSDLTTRRGFWIVNLCKVHEHLLQPDRSAKPYDAPERVEDGDRRL